MKENNEVTLLNIIHSHKVKNFILISLSFFSAILSTGTAVVLTFTVNEMVNGDIRNFLFFVVIDALLWFILLLVSYFYAILKEKMSQDILIEIREYIVDKLIGTTYTAVQDNPKGTYYSWLSDDMKEIKEKGIIAYYSIWDNIFSIVLSTIALFIYHWSLVLVIFILLIILLKFPSLFSKKIKTATQNISNTNAKFSNNLQDILAGYETLFGFNKLDKMNQKTREYSVKLGNNYVKYQKDLSTANNAIGFVNVLSQLTIITYTGILIINKMLPIGAFSTTGNLGSAIFNSTSQISSNKMLFDSIQVYFDKYESFLSINEVKVKDSEHELKLEQNLTLDNISYKIKDNDILSNITLVIEKGKKYALIGDSGSGKTTLLNILSGKILDYDGNMYIDGNKLINSEKNSLRENVIHIVQKPHIFQTTLDSNITLWDDQSDAKYLYDSLNIDDFIDYNAFIDENGRNLSGGQQQRISLARGLFHATDKLVLLDESTSNLDKKSALKLENMFLEDKNLTVILVTHRLYDENRASFDHIIDLNNV